MAESPESTRTRLIREMARDMNKLRNMSGSATGSLHGNKADINSTASSFDPDNEAIVSTRNLDLPSRALPELRDSAKKYRNYRQPPAEVHIDTSAIHRAFPDFTQGSRSFEGSISVEIGRGGPVRDVTEANSSLMDFDASQIEQNLPRNRNRFQTQVSRNTQGGYNHDAVYASAPNSENNTTNDHPTLPAPSGFTTAKDLVHRLGKAAPSLHPYGATKQAFFKPDPPINHPADITDIPNLSELISGVYEDGTPVFSGISPKETTVSTKQGRKTKLSHVELASIPTPDDEQAIYISLKLLQEKVAALESRKVEDAAAIATLRVENEALAREKYESQRSKRSDSALGSTSGSDAGDEAGHGARRVTIQKARLESRLQHIQEELRAANSKCQISAETIQNISHERDAATNQLGIAYLTNERLKAEVKALKAENERLKIGLEGAIETSNRRFQEPADTEKTASQVQAGKATAHQTRGSDDQDHMQLFDFDVNHISGSQPSAPGVGASSAVRQHASRSNDFTQSQPQSQPQLGSRIRDMPYSVSVEPMANGTGIRSANTDQSSNHPEAGHAEEPIPVTQITREEHVLAGQTASATAHHRLREQVQSTKQPDVVRYVLPEDMTILSAEHGYKDEIFPEIRAMLEEARRARNHPRVQYELSHGYAPQAKLSRPLMDDLVVLSQKSGNENRTRLSMPTYTTGRGKQHDLTGLSDKFPHVPLRSDDSLLKQSSQRNGVPMDEMTSAYIVPDITLRNPDAAGKPRVSYKSRPGNITEHDLDVNDMLRESKEPRKPQDRMHNKASIPRPVPASERTPSPTPSNPDPTMRPSEQPGLSLARVIKSLNDEISAIKDSLQVLERASYQDDPGMSKRKRIERERQITALRKSKNNKSDQVYYLMNVLEGQKLAGQEMTESQIEVTLQSAGVEMSQLELQLDPSEDADLASDESIDIDDDISDFDPIDSSPPTLPRIRESLNSQRLSSKGAAQPMKPALKKTIKHPWDDLDETEELPWEGFESTGNVTGRSARSSDSQHNRRASQ